MATTPAVRGSRIEDVPEGDVDYVLADPSRYLGTHANAVPLPANVQAARVFYGARFHNQALPLEHPDVPLVQTAVDGHSLEHELGGMAGRIHSKKAGTVTSITPDSIEVTDGEGNAHPHAVYNNFPFNRVTGIHSKAAVKKGDTVKEGDMLASSNFTDSHGTLALGANARIALAPYLGHSMDDATVISEDFARRLASSHLEGYDHSLENGAKGGLGHFTSLFPRKYKAEQLKGMNEHGVVQPGTIVRQGDPLILATKPRSISSATAQLGLLSKSMREARQDSSVVWDHSTPGKVVDSHQTKDGVKLSIATTRPTKVGDKLVLRSGSKGVVSLILPTDRVPRNSEGVPFDVILNPLTIPSRTNNAGVFELLLGKAAAKRGAPYILPVFDPKRGSTHAFVAKELADNGLNSEEDLFDPVLGRKLDQKVLTGIGHVLKLSHTSESKTSSRGVGSYDINDQPSKGSGDSAQSKRLSGLESSALLSSGAYGVLREGATLRGSRNDNYWRTLREGYTPAPPGAPKVWYKFRALLGGAGIHTSGKDRGRIRLGPLTDRHLDERHPVEVKTGGLVDIHTLEPDPQGLFSPSLVSSNRWGSVSLDSHIPNPAFEKQIRQLLGLKESELRNILAGTQELPERLR